MSAIDDVVRANQQYAPADSPPGRPGRKLAVVACMDTRLDLLDGLGLRLGDAHWIRNAGGLITPDVLRSLAISQHALGTEEIAALHHTQCGMTGFDDTAFRAELLHESGKTPDWDVPGFTDAYEQLRESLAAVRACPWLPHRDAVRGFVYDVATGRLDEVS